MGRNTEWGDRNLLRKKKNLLIGLKLILLRNIYGISNESLYLENLNDSCLPTICRHNKI